jgi:hypothetical protein
MLAEWVFLFGWFFFFFFGSVQKVLIFSLLVDFLNNLMDEGKNTGKQRIMGGKELTVTPILLEKSELELKSSGAQFNHYFCIS